MQFLFQLLFVIFSFELEQFLAISVVNDTKNKYRELSKV